MDPGWLQPLVSVRSTNFYRHLSRLWEGTFSQDRRGAKHPLKHSQLIPRKFFFKKVCLIWQSNDLVQVLVGSEMPGGASLGAAPWPISQSVNLPRIYFIRDDLSGSHWARKMTDSCRGPAADDISPPRLRHASTAFLPLIDILLVSSDLRSPQQLTGTVAVNHLFFSGAVDG